MTKLSITLAIASLTISLAPAASAYSLAPETEPYEISSAAQINVLIGAARQQQDGICELNVTPVLAEALGLSTPIDAQETTIALAACEPE